MSAKITSTLQGVPALFRAIQLCDAATHARTVAAIKRGTEAVVAKARSAVHKRSGELAFTIRGEYSANGLTGFAKAGYGTLPRRSRASTEARRAHLAQRRGMTGEERRLQFRLAPTSKQALATKGDLGVYAPVVERGDPHRHHKAHPYLVPALASSQAEIMADLERATKGAIADAGLA